MLEIVLAKYKGAMRDDGLVEYRTVTPAFSSRNFAWEHPDRSALIVAFVATGFREDLLSAIVHLSASIPLRNLPSALALLPGLRNPANPKMGHLCVVPPTFHRHFATWDRDLAFRTFQMFPAYRSDFGGWESQELYDELIHARTHILEWDRVERPQIWLKAKSSHAALQGWLADEFMLADLPDLDQEIPNLKSPGDFAIVRNHLKQDVQITRQAEHVITVSPELGGKIATEETGELLRRLRSFVC